jgi:AraC-like DNA-binding protein
MPQIDKLLSEIDILPQPVNAFFGSIIYEPQGTYGPRVQDHYQFVIVYSGQATIYIDGHASYLGRDEVAFLKPGHFEFFEFCKDSSTHHSWCHFHWHLDGEFTEILESLPFKMTLSNRMKQLIDVGLSFQRDPHTLFPAHQNLAAAVFWEYTSLVAMSSSTSPYGRLPNALQRVQSYVTSHYQHEITLETLSQVAHITPEHLIRLFRLHLGTTPMRYVWQIRAQQGASYLCHTDFTVERVALSCGFKTAAHFSRVIRKQYGQAPLELKAWHQKRYVHQPE